MDALGVNVAIGASQKGLMVHPGLAFVAADARALAVARANPTPRFYWDWQRRQSEMSYRKFCGTPPLAHMAGLEAALGLIAHEGLANVQARHARLARAVHAAVDGVGRRRRAAPLHAGPGGALGLGDGDRGLAPASTRRRCARSRASASRSPSPAASARSAAASFASATSAT